jgi:HlyD family secretion protein
MKTVKTIIIIVLIVLAATATWYFGFRKTEQVIVINSEKLKRGYISQSVTATGTIQPVDTVAVGTQVSGTIKSIYADFNSVVKKGQLLAELDKTLFVASVNQFKANLLQAQSQLVYQKGNYDRQSQLYKVGAISKADYDNALYTLNSAKASVSSIEAQLQSAQKNLDLASIYSPIDGTILSRNVSEGQTVAASFSTPTLFSIAKDLTKMQVRAAVDEADIGNIKEGERVNFTVDAFLNDIFKGTIREIRLSPSTSSNVVTYATIIDAPNNEKKLKPGMTASITIFTNEADSALLIPARALKYSPDSSLTKQYQIISDKNKQMAANGEAHVWIKSGNQIIQKKIKTGINDNTHVQVLEGLSDNDEVITGSQIINASEAKTDDSASSPFMPKRPGSNTKKK